MPTFTRTKQQWQWLIGKLWHGYYRYRCDDHENPYLNLIQTIQAKLEVGNPVDMPIAVFLSPLAIEEIKEDYADAIRRSGTLGRQPHDDVLPELLERLPGTSAGDRSGPEDLPNVREEPVAFSGLEGYRGYKALDPDAV